MVFYFNGWFGGNCVGLQCYACLSIWLYTLSYSVACLSFLVKRCLEFLPWNSLQSIHHVCVYPFLEMRVLVHIKIFESKLATFWSANSQDSIDWAVKQGKGGISSGLNKLHSVYDKFWVCQAPMEHIITAFRLGVTRVYNSMLSPWRTQTKYLLYTTNCTRTFLSLWLANMKRTYVLTNSKMCPLRPPKGSKMYPLRPSTESCKEGM